MKQTQNHTIIPNETYTISLEEAQTRIAAWKESQQTILEESGLPAEGGLPPLRIKAFTFTTNDLFALCERIYNYNNPYEPKLNIMRSELEKPVDAMRFYVGNRMVDNVLKQEACLIAVPVVGFDLKTGSGGKDMVALPYFGGGEVVVPTIYDFSYPCPATCAIKGESIMDKKAQSAT